MNGDPRFPIGPWTPPSTITPVERAADLMRLEILPRQLRAAVEGLSDAQLDTPYREGGWTVRQLVHHVADSHMNGYIRSKLALTEDNPTIRPYDQEAWAERPDSRLPIEVSLQLLESVHLRWVALLRGAPAAAFQRPYQHPEAGAFTVDTGLSQYAWHGEHHVAHILALRTREGW